MRTSLRGLVEIASHEGIVTSRYRDSVGVWTIGIGHTAAAGGMDPANVRHELSMDEVFALFEADIIKYERRVNRAFTRKLTQSQFDAAVSFDYNTGGILRATWVKLFNAGDDRAAARSFMTWKRPPEIIPRRRKERDLFFNGTYSANGRARVYPAVNGRVQWSKGKTIDVEKRLRKPTGRDPAPEGGKIPPAPPVRADGFWARILAALGRLFRRKSNAKVSEGSPDPDIRLRDSDTRSR